MTSDQGQMDNLIEPSTGKLIENEITCTCVLERGVLHERMSLTLVDFFLQREVALCTTYVGQGADMIGDRVSDKLAAEKSGLKFYYAKQNFFAQIKSIINN